METEEGVEFAERTDAIYDCPQGHTVILPFSIEAEIPGYWQCRCGEYARFRHGDNAERPTGKKTRTHWDMLRERRSIEELEALLEERLTLLRAGRARAHAASARA